MTTRIAQERATQHSAVAGATEGTKMAKNKKLPKTHTVREVDELNHLAEREGFMLGMVEGHRIFYTTLIQVKAAIENMQAIYYIGNLTGARKQKLEELQLVWDTLTHLEDLFEDRYYISIDNAQDPENYDELLHEHDLVDWRDSVASLKEEWPL
jgi:hypothetical protein